MARPREFDEAEVIARARDRFWGHGVAATSIADLSEATGLSVGSIYKAFKSKDQLCARTLEDYVDQAQARASSRLDDSASALDGLRAWLDDYLQQATIDAPTCGCYAVELATERAAVDDTVRDILVAHDAAMRTIVGRCVGRAVDAGELSGDPEGLTRLVLTTVNGLQVDARKGLAAVDARLTIDTLLTAAGA
ncbi:MAG: TetR/AcrR family transcriptional regulator [Actinomycetota bacterium]